MSDPLAKLRDRRLQAALALMPKDRSCDGCDLCCTAVGVRELGKAPSEACAHLCSAPGGSCGIYDKRPISCREFYCAWRCGFGMPIEWKPSEVGWVVAINDATTHPVIVTIHPDPDRPDAWDTAAFRRFFSMVADNNNCLVVIGQGLLSHTIFAPRNVVFTKATAPELFIDGGLRIGAPEELFYPTTKRPGPSRELTSKLTGTRYDYGQSGEMDE